MQPEYRLTLVQTLAWESVHYLIHTATRVHGGVRWNEGETPTPYQALVTEDRKEGRGLTLSLEMWEKGRHLGTERKKYRKKEGRKES